MGQLHREIKAYEDRLRRASVKFTLAEIQAAGAVLTLAKEFGDIPANAIIEHVVLKRTVAVTDGAAGTFGVTVGDGTTADNVLAAGDVDGGATPVLDSTHALIAGGGTFTATLTGSVNLSTVTAGEFEIEVRFAA